MAIKHVDGDFPFPTDFGFTGSAQGRHDARNHPSGGDDDYGDGRYAEPLGLKRGGTVRGTREQQASQDPTYQLAHIAQRGEAATPPDITPQRDGGRAHGGHRHPHGHHVLGREAGHDGSVIEHHAHGGHTVHHSDGSIRHHDRGGHMCGNYDMGGPAMPAGMPGGMMPGTGPGAMSTFAHGGHMHHYQGGGPAITGPTGPTRPTGGAPMPLRPPAGGAPAMPPGRAPAPGAGPPAQLGGPMSRASLTMPATDAMKMGASMVQAGRRQGAQQAIGALAGAAANKRAQAVMGAGAPAMSPAAQPPSDATPGIQTMAHGGHHKEFNPGGHKGKLHRELGIPEGEKIPAGRLESAAHSSNPEVKRDAIRAQTMKKWH